MAPTSTKRAVTVPSNGARSTSYDFITANCSMFAWAMR